ncbi:MAG: hypothetical protein CMC05_07925 [Flavobacteriaceae bacterium]|nr:hypothetical protein [Flavobacteriaceae bacterium]MBD10437.1 hypothetical protein [Flavobacteriaceae bacterium]|tara:strand:+ start:127 stop:492 length:366 start_codon:yes stop_codon:yes gene_type:complete
MLDNYYIALLNYYKKRLGKRSLTIALFYINVLELSILMSLGTFFMAFATQMKINSISSNKFWILFSLASLFIMFKNWMRYNGKKRNILNAKSRSKTPSIYLLWLLPIGCIVLAFVFLQVLA